MSVRRLPRRRPESAAEMSVTPQASGRAESEEQPGWSMARPVYGRRAPARAPSGRPVLHSATGPAPRDVAAVSGGDVAQLGEHRVRIAGVRGSSPLISTSATTARTADGPGHGSVGQVVSPRVCKTLVFDCGSSILPRPTSSPGCGTGVHARLTAGLASYPSPPCRPAPAAARRTPRASACAGCAARRSRPPSAAPRVERKVVTVLFCDLVGFTSRAERLDPEDVQALLGPVPRTRPRRARAPRRHRREVHRRRGDGALRRPDGPRGRPRAGGSGGPRDPRSRHRGGTRAAGRDHDRRGARLARRAPGRGRGDGLGRRRQHRRPPAGAPRP